MALLEKRSRGRPDGQAGRLRTYTALVVREIITMAQPLSLGDIEWALNIGRVATSRRKSTRKHTGEYLMRYQSGKSGMGSAAALHRLCAAAYSHGWLTKRTMRDVELTFPELGVEPRIRPEEVRRALRSIDARYREVLRPLCVQLMKVAARIHEQEGLHHHLRGLGCKDSKSLGALSVQELCALAHLLSRDLSRHVDAVEKALQLERRRALPEVRF